MGDENEEPKETKVAVVEEGASTEDNALIKLSLVLMRIMIVDG